MVRTCFAAGAASAGRRTPTEFTLSAASAAATTPRATRASTSAPATPARGPWPRCLIGCLLLAREGVWIEGIPDAVTEQCEPGHGDGYHDGREQGQVPVKADVVHALSDHLTPARRGRLNAQTQEGEGRLGE